MPAGLPLLCREGFEAQVRPRSGLAVKHGLTVLNSPGTIDADYRGEIRCILVNLGNESVAVTRGMRIAQMVVATVTRAQLTEVDSRPNTPWQRRFRFDRQLKFSFIALHEPGLTATAAITA